MRGVNMKLIWNKCSYVIILISVSLVISFILSYQVHSFHDDKYIKITVSKGDTLWKIADEYSEKSLSGEKFINWVKNHNNIEEDRIFPGDQIVIPVNKESVPAGEYASAAEK